MIFGLPHDLVQLMVKVMVMMLCHFCQKQDTKLPDIVCSDREAPRNASYPEILAEIHLPVTVHIWQFMWSVECQLFDDSRGLCQCAFGDASKFRYTQNNPPKCSILVDPSF